MDQHVTLLGEREAEQSAPGCGGWWRRFEQEAAEKAQGWASRLTQGLNITSYEFMVESAELAEATLGRELPRDRCPALYTIELMPSVVELAKVAFDELKATYPGEPKTPKLVDGNRLGPCLYVGKCDGQDPSVRGRLREHFLWGGDRRAGTTALRLRWWLPADCWPVKVWAATLKPADPNEGRLPKHLIGFLEDLLWEKRQPLVGRQGGN